MEELWTLDQALIWIATKNREMTSDLDLLWTDLITAWSNCGPRDRPGPVRPAERPIQDMRVGPVLDWPRAEAKLIEALREERLRVYRVVASGPEFAGATITFDSALRARITLLPPPRQDGGDDLVGSQHERPQFAPKDVMVAFPAASHDAVATIAASPPAAICNSDIPVHEEEGQGGACGSIQIVLIVNKAGGIDEDVVAVSPARSVDGSDGVLIEEAQGTAQDAPQITPITNAAELVTLYKRRAETLDRSSEQECWNFLRGLNPNIRRARAREIRREHAPPAWSKAGVKGKG